MTLRSLVSRPSSSGSSSWTGLGVSVGGHAVLLGALALTGLGLHAGSNEATTSVALTAVAQQAPTQLDLTPLASWTLEEQALIERPELDVTFAPTAAETPASAHPFAAHEPHVAPRTVPPPAHAARGAIERSTARATGPESTSTDDAPAPVIPAPSVPSESGTTQAHSSGRTCAPALPTNLSQPAYPSRAQRRGWEGRVVLELDVDARGKVKAARIATSSGRGLLDNAARDHALGWTLTPALRDGRAVAGTLRVPVRFTLE